MVTSRCDRRRPFRGVMACAKDSPPSLRPGGLHRTHKVPPVRTHDDRQTAPGLRAAGMTLALCAQALLPPTAAEHHASQLLIHYRSVFCCTNPVATAA